MHVQASTLKTNQVKVVRRAWLLFYFYFFGNQKITRGTTLALWLLLRIILPMKEVRICYTVLYNTPVCGSLFFCLFYRKLKKRRTGLVLLLLRLLRLLGLVVLLRLALFSSKAPHFFLLALLPLLSFLFSQSPPPPPQQQNKKSTQRAHRIRYSITRWWHWPSNMFHESFLLSQYHQRRYTAITPNKVQLWHITQ